MQQDSIKTWQESSYFAGANAAYIEELYEAYLDDPNSVDDQWRTLFAELPGQGEDVAHAP
ncbi:MAG: hypothetical protein R3Y10_02525, partial [Ferrimonas sp.]